MNETYRIEKLEDMPKYVPIIFIKDNGIKNSKSRMVGSNIHDRIVLESNGSHLYYYNLQCGKNSHDCSDFRFIKREATCYDDEFYSHFCQMVDLEELIADYTKQVRKQVLEEIRYSLLDFSHNYWKVFKQNGKQYMTDDDLMEFLEKIGEEEKRK